MLTTNPINDTITELINIILGSPTRTDEMIIVLLLFLIGLTLWNGVRKK